MRYYLRAHAFALLIALALAMAATACRAQDSATGHRAALDISELSDGVASLTPHLDILEDPEGQLTLADVRSAAVAHRFTRHPTNTPTISHGYTRSAFWLRLHVHNASAQPLKRLLELGYAALTSVDIFQPGANGAYSAIATGSAHPFASRPYANHNFVFPLQLAPRSSQVIYLRLQSSSSVLIPARLWVPEEFAQQERNDYVAQAWYFGMATAMVLFNLVLYIALRDSIYLLYVAFVLSTAFALGADRGMAHEFLWPHAGGWTAIANFIGYSLCVSTFVLFSRRMLATAEILPRIDTLMRLLTWVLLLSPIGFLVAPFAVAQPVVLLYLSAALLMMAVTVICLVIKRQRSALFYAAAFAAFLGGCLITALMYLGIIENTPLTANAVQIGSAVEMVLLALALADRFNTIRQQNDKAQKEQIRAEQGRVEALRESEQLLESRVEARTAELSTAIERLTLAQNELVQSEKMASLGALVAGIAHELNTPIGNALITSTSLDASVQDFEKLLADGPIRRDDLSDFMRRNRAMADLIHRSCERAASLITSFKQVAVDQASEQRRSFSLRALIDDNVTALRPTLKRTPYVIEVDMADDITLDSFPGPLGQVLTNLVQNAINHAFAGRAAGTIRLSARVDGPLVVLECADDGVGMSPEIRARIFEPFFTTRLGQGGSGLGLSICHNIIHGMLNGELQVHSEPGQGTRFIARLPRIAPRTRPPQQTPPT